ncbi:hypothetical protein EW026_g7386 [Hermanssonia centrifuga]|uniref:Uncharacterized protein n=1 Tax=Hermanssonia centrifuga TaxID=98765 RepID=A0A4S4K805_9APHY|nr:hypothetical protein EW026_g7386 [Hermanssonia centrifuga]
MSQSSLTADIVAAYEADLVDAFISCVTARTNICAFILATVTYTADPVLGTFCESAMSTQNVPDAATLHFYLTRNTPRSYNFRYCHLGIDMA